MDNLQSTDTGDSLNNSEKKPCFQKSLHTFLLRCWAFTFWPIRFNYFGSAVVFKWRLYCLCMSFFFVNRRNSTKNIWSSVQPNTTSAERGVEDNMGNFTAGQRSRTRRLRAHNECVFIMCVSDPVLACQTGVSCVHSIFIRFFNFQKKKILSAFFLPACMYFSV